MNMTYTAGSRMRSRVFFYAGTGILAVKVLLMYSAIFQIPETLDNILVILGVTCLLTKIIFQQYTWKAFLRCAVLGGFTCICTVRSRIVIYHAGNLCVSRYFYRRFCQDALQNPDRVSVDSWTALCHSSFPAARAFVI